MPHGRMLQLVLPRHRAATTEYDSVELQLPGLKLPQTPVGLPHDTKSIVEITPVPGWHRSVMLLAATHGPVGLESHSPRSPPR